MELWIRSQDGEVLGKAKEIMIYEKEKRCEIIINNYTYGTYATKERALEVLDEIQDTIKLKQSWQLNKNSFKVCIQKGGYDEEQVMKIMDKMYVYEMPKE